MSNPLEQECYALIQAVVLARDVFCRAPGCVHASASAHHIFKRDRLATAFNPTYLVGLCLTCHTSWAHGHPEEFREWLLSWMGDAYYEGLRLSNTIVKNYDYKCTRDALRKTLKALLVYDGRLSDLHYCNL